MLSDFLSVLKPEILITILIGVAAFATVLTLATPRKQDDVLKSRMKAVNAERDKLRAARRAEVEAGESRLREKSGNSFARQVVDFLHLRTVFEAEASRDLLRQAGLRRESHLVSFLAARLVAPPVLAALAFIYSITLFPDSMSAAARITVTMVAALAGLYVPMVFVRNLVLRRRQSISRAWSDALDLMLICIDSGMALEPALQRVSREIGSISVPLAEELTLTSAELSYLQDRRKALENLAKRTGLPMVKAVVTSFIQSERYGTPLGSALRVLAQENRDARMSEVERKAAGLGPKLTVPMIVFFLPGIFVILLGPSAINLLKFM